MVINLLLTLTGGGAIGRTINWQKPIARKSVIQITLNLRVWRMVTRLFLSLVPQWSSNFMYTQRQRVRLASAMREACLSESYGLTRLCKDLLAGLTVGIIAIPLSMALAIASGVPPQHGLYTAVIAGVVIAALGGSRFSVSGPTAAFVVILYPVAQQFGVAGLLVASLMCGVILLLMGLGRLGRLIGYIPMPVTLGFTMGIGIVIATLQIKDFFGLTLAKMPEHYVDKVQALWLALPSWQGGDTLVGAVTLATLLIWPRLRLPFPGHLPAVLLGWVVSYVLAGQGIEVATIGSRFSYALADGTIGHGIPSSLPTFALPWNLPGPDGQPLHWDWGLFRALLPAAFSMALLGAIESLLCAVVLDGMTGRKHHSNTELIGQGIGNMLAPFFGGITATAAIARSAANVRAGATSPVAAMVHGVVVLLALLVLASQLSALPLAAMSALLLMVAWNMSEAPKVWGLIRKAPRNDTAIMLTCLSLTVLFDMVVAITFGIVLASLLFMRDIAKMTRLVDLKLDRRYAARVPDGWQAYKISGPLFFAAADRLFTELQARAQGLQGVVLQWDGVSILDAGGFNAFEACCRQLRQDGVRVLIAEVPFQPLKTLARAKFSAEPGWLEFVSTLDEVWERLDAPANAA